MNTAEKNRRAFLEDPEPKTIAILIAVGERAKRKVPESQLKADITAAREEIQAARKSSRKKHCLV